MFDSSTGSPGRSAVVVHPPAMDELSGCLALLAQGLRRSRSRLAVATSQVRLNPADPAWPPIARHIGSVGPGPFVEVDRSADELDHAAAEITRTSRGFVAVDRVAGAMSVAAVRLAVANIDRTRRSLDLVSRIVGIGLPGSGRPVWAVPGPIMGPDSRREVIGGSPNGRNRGTSGAAGGSRLVGWVGPGVGGRGGGRPIPGRSDEQHRRVERGRRALADALARIGDPGWIGPDEIGLIDHGGGSYTVLLPGVIDLARPSPGWNQTHRSVRDLDMAAVSSARSSAVADNPYALAVERALDRAGVEPGSRLTVVGHSFGADTALDLAADADFSRRRYRLERVVAAGYHSQPQLPALVGETDVLVLQNSRDVVIEAERLGQWALAPTRTFSTEMLDALGAEAGSPAATSVVLFDGGTRGFGHHPDNYRRFVEGTAEREERAEMERFLAEAGSAPSSRGGLLRALSVRVEE